MSGHTPIEWRAELNDYHMSHQIVYGDWPKCENGGDIGVIWERDDARFVVTAANSHDELLSTAKAAREVIERVLHLNEEWLRPADADALRTILEALEEAVGRAEA